MTLLEFMSGERESRTGVTRLNQGLDRDALNKTATGAALQSAQGQQYEEFIARNFAESFARLFMKKMRLMKAVGEKITIKVQGKYRETDPATWPDEADIVIRVGLGTGNKEQRLGALSAMLQFQREGMAEGLVKPQHVRKTIEGFVKNAGLGQADDYWPNAEEAMPEQQERPDPEMAKVEAQMQLNQAKLQGEQALAAERLRLMRDEASAKADLQREQAERDATLARARAEAEMQLARERMAFEQELAVERLAFEGSTRNLRPGGDLSE
jgi:hypothetical protein